MALKFLNFCLFLGCFYGYSSNHPDLMLQDLSDTPTNPITMFGNPLNELHRDLCLKEREFRSGLPAESKTNIALGKIIFWEKKTDGITYHTLHLEHLLCSNPPSNVLSLPHRVNMIFDSATTRDIIMDTASKLTTATEEFVVDDTLIDVNDVFTAKSNLPVCQKVYEKMCRGKKSIEVTEREVITGDTVLKIKPKKNISFFLHIF